MAVLADADRVDVRDQYIRELSSERAALAGVVKADIRAAVNAMDDFLNANAGAINSAIPLPARTALTAAQKARLMKFVITKRYISGA